MSFCVLECWVEVGKDIRGLKFWGLCSDESIYLLGVILDVIVLKWCFGYKNWDGVGVRVLKL